VFGQSKEALAAPKVREDFRDTLLWLPEVETDAQGEARVEVRLPDDLTQWRLTARAISLSDSVGQATQTITTTLPVIARLSTPRFLVRGDEATLRVIGQNNLEKSQAGQLRLEATGLTLLTPPPPRRSFPRGAGLPSATGCRPCKVVLLCWRLQPSPPLPPMPCAPGCPSSPKGSNKKLAGPGSRGIAGGLACPPAPTSARRRPGSTSPPHWPPP